MNGTYFAKQLRMDPVDVKGHLFGNVTRQLLYKSLDANAMRSRAISQNIANAMTPGYERVEVDFEEQVRRAMKIQVDGTRTDDEHLEIGREASLKRVDAQTYRPYDPTNPGELNNVDIDIENAKMAENQIQYNFNIEFSGFEKYMAAIKGQTY